jgi:hypothetical protein
MGDNGLDFFHLRDAQVPYNNDFTSENGVLSAINAYFWNVGP